MQLRILVAAVLVLLAVPIVGCAELITTPNVRVTWTPTGDTEGNEFPPEATVTQSVEYGLQGSGLWSALPGAENVPYAGAGASHVVFWTLPDMQSYVFRVALRVVLEGAEFVRYCETDAVRYFGVGPVACDVEADE